MANSLKEASMSGLDINQHNLFGSVNYIAHVLLLFYRSMCSDFYRHINFCSGWLFNYMQIQSTPGILFFLKLSH